MNFGDLFLAPGDTPTPGQAEASMASLQAEVRAFAARALDPDIDRNERLSVWRQLRSKCRKIAPRLEDEEERELVERIAFYGQPASGELPALMQARLRVRSKSQPSDSR